MEKVEILLMLDDLLELDDGTLQGVESLEELSEWDSLAVIGFIALADEHFNKRLGSKQIGDAETIDGLVALLVSD